MKTLIALLFIAALPLMGQKGRWLNKQQYDSLYFANKISTTAHPLSVQNAFVEWLNSQTHVKVTVKDGGRSTSLGLSYVALGTLPSGFFYGYMLGKYDEQKKSAYFHPDTNIATMQYDEKSNSMKNLSIAISLSVTEKNDSTYFRVQVSCDLSRMPESSTDKEAVDFAKNNEIVIYSNRYRRDAEKYILSKLK